MGAQDKPQGQGGAAARPRAGHDAAAGAHPRRGAQAGPLRTPAALDFAPLNIRVLRGALRGVLSAAGSVSSRRSRRRTSA